MGSGLLALLVVGPELRLMILIPLNGAPVVLMQIDPSIYDDA